MRGDVETYKFNGFILSCGESVKSASIGELLKKVFGTQFVHQPAPEAFAKLRKVPLRSAQVNSIWGANKRQFAIALMVSLSLSTALSRCTSINDTIQVNSSCTVQSECHDQPIIAVLRLEGWNRRCRDCVEYGRRFVREAKFEIVLPLFVTNG